MKDSITAFEIYLQIKKTTAYLISKKIGVKKQSIYTAVSNPNGVEALKGKTFIQVGEALNVSAGSIIDTVREMEAILSNEIISCAFILFPASKYIEKGTDILVLQKKVIIILLAEAYMEFFNRERSTSSEEFENKVRDYLIKNQDRFIPRVGKEKDNDK